MSISAWIGLDPIARLSEHARQHDGEGFILDIALGIVGAIVGGWLFSLFGRSRVTGLNLDRLVVAVVRAAVVFGGLSRCLTPALTVAYCRGGRIT